MKTDTITKVEFVLAHFEVHLHHRHTYACKCCQEGVVKAPKLQRAIDCFAEPSLLSHMAVCKFVDHIPLYRQEAILNRIGVPIDDGTMSRWTTN